MGRLIVVSNRLPVKVDRVEGHLRVQRSSGGLVSALEPILSRSGGCWIGWPGTELTPEVLIRLQTREAPYQLSPVSLTSDEVNGYYHGCANSVFWPLFHGFSSACRFDPDFWEFYQSVNLRFAEAILRVATSRDFIWVHDYHLMTVASELREPGCSRLKIGYFHHIPFPDPETFGKLPWRNEVLHSLLQFNVVGFQTANDKRNFVASLNRYLPLDLEIEQLENSSLVRTGDTSTVVGAFPIGIDFKQFDCEPSPAQSMQVASLRAQLPEQKLLLGIDRLDYTKGILERLAAFENLLTQHPEWIGKVHFIQVVVPSREDVDCYAELRQAIERRISNINGRFGVIGWLPITYLHRSLSPEELMSFYRAADVAVVTPLRDGMNLVAKEFCASRTDEQGVLVLSEFAGAAEELQCGALLTNPYDVVQTTNVIRRALMMASQEAKNRMRSMRGYIRDHDVWRWCRAFRGTKSAGSMQPLPVEDVFDRTATQAVG